MYRVLLGAVIGYVLGARAGRQRYEQLARLGRRVAEHPTVRNAASRAKDGAVDYLHNRH